MDESREKELEKVADMAAEKAVKNHILSKKQKCKRWFHNTEKLMGKYNMLKEHTESSISGILETDLRDCLCDFISEDDEEELRIESIQRSELRTYIIVEHIDKMLNVLKNIYMKKKKMRKYRALTMRFLEQQECSYIAKYEKVDERTIYRDVNDALNDLSILLFGLDGMLD